MGWTDENIDQIIVNPNGPPEIIIDGTGTNAVLAALGQNAGVLFEGVAGRYYLVSVENNTPSSSEFHIWATDGTVVRMQVVDALINDDTSGTQQLFDDNLTFTMDVGRANPVITAAVGATFRLRGTNIAAPIAYDNAGTAETWQTMTLLNGFTNRGGGYVNAKYRRVASPPNCVQVVGEVQTGTVAAGTIIATLPAGYRPTNIIPLVVQNSGVPANKMTVLELDSSGNLKLWDYGAGVVGFNGLYSLDA